MRVKVSIGDVPVGVPFRCHDNPRQTVYTRTGATHGTRVGADAMWAVRWVDDAGYVHTGGLFKSRSVFVDGPQVVMIFPESEEGPQS